MGSLTENKQKSIFVNFFEKIVTEFFP